MERQELVLVGVLALQQQLSGATRRQRDAGGGEPAAEAAGRPAGLRQQLPLLSRRHELPAHPHLRNLFPPARRTHLHDLEQVHYDPFGAARARLCGRGALGFSGAAAAAADGSVPTGVALFDGDEDLPLRGGPLLAKSAQAPVAVKSDRGTEGHRPRGRVLLHPDERTFHCLMEKVISVSNSVLLVHSHPVSHKSITEWKQGLLTASAAPEGSAQHLI